MLTAAHNAHPCRRRIVGVSLRVVATLVVLVCFTSSVFADSGSLKEHQLKAAFLYNMAKFVDWPPQTFGAATTPIVIGVMGDQVVRQELEIIVRDRSINGRAIIIMPVSSLDEAATTHVLFVQAEEEQHFAPMWPKIRQLAILTVGETASFSEIGGAIRFTPVGDKLRFEINITSAERAGLKVSSQLQKLATLVHREQ